MKVIVAHPGRQHSFRVAAALKKNNALYKYITTVYDKEDSFLMKVIKICLSPDNKRRAASRKCKTLLDDDVVLFESLLGYLLLLVQRMDRTRKFSNKLSDYISLRFQRKLAKYAIEHKVDAIIAYDTNCAECFQILKKRGSSIVCIMDNAAPNRNYLYHIYNRNLEQCGPFVKTFKPFRYLWDKTEAQRFADEISYVDYHIVASTFSKEALMFEGVHENCIYVVPYGMDSARFEIKDRKHKEGQLNLLYVGQVNQRKGIYQILEAAKHINNPNIHFNIVGNGVEEVPEVYKPYEKFVTFHGSAYFEKLLKHYAENDVLLFPSMGDGFGFVILEAMAAGLPVIASTNSAGPDVIIEGKNGFLIPICNTQALIDKILWFWSNQNFLCKMSEESIKTAQKYTWDNYDKELMRVIHTVLKQ